MYYLDVRLLKTRQYNGIVSDHAWK